MSKEEQAYHNAASAQTDAVESQLFGKPCYKIGGKAFCCFFQGEMVFKLSGENHSDALALDGSKLFDPSGKGRPMKEWVQVPYAYTDQWEEFSQVAHGYVSGSK